MTGRSGSGKSKMLETLFYDLQLKSQKEKDYALVLLDPHGDLARNILYFSHNQDKSRVVYISSSINREIEKYKKTDDRYTAVINPFDNDGTEETVNILSQELTDALIELLDNSYNFTPQMQAILRPCIATVLRSKNPCINELKRFMLDGQNGDLIELGRQSPNSQHRDFFMNDFHIEEYRLTKKSIRTKLSYFLGDQILSDMLNGKSTIDLEQCLNEGKVIIFNLPKGSGKFTSSVFGRLMIAYIHSIILRRDALPREQRKQLFFFIDEFQNYITSSLASNLAEARKYGLSLILATQSLKQIENLAIRKTVMVNTSFKAVSQTDYEDRSTFSKELGVRGKDLEELKPLQFYVKDDTGQNPFKIEIPILANKYFLTEEERKRLLQYLVYRSGQYVPVPVEQPHIKNIIKKDKPEATGDKPENKTEDVENKKKKPNPKSNPFDEDLKPAF
ncbi:MAG: type IV secretory system conjugative DNA transfer family protein [Paludibacteraceae bacterium]